MLPSMPLISTPLMESSDEAEEGDGDADDGEVGIKSVNKYHRKGTKTSPADTAEKQPLRLIAPKPITVVISPSPVVSVGSQPNGGMLPEAQDRPDLDPLAETMEKQSQPLEEQRGDIVLAEGQKDSPKEERKDVVTSDKKDNEDELAALMLASTTIRSSPKSRSGNVAKKKSKHIRDIEATLNLLTPDSDNVRDEKAFGFAQAYFMKVTERLEGKDDVLYQEFLKTMNDFGHTIFSVPELYRKITSMLTEYPDLAEEFLAFLLPEQAMQCGKFMEHLVLTKMKDFFRKLEVYFIKQPQQMRKIYSGLSLLSSQNNITIQDVRSTIIPLLKGNSFLIDSFLQLLPEERPQDSCLTEFEEMDCGDADSCHSGDNRFETVNVPDQKDPYGGDHCLCVCHETGDDKYKRRALHCVSCGTKFLYGRVFVQTGKVLRPAKVVFNDDKMKTIKRLSVKDHPKSRSRKKTAVSASKDSTPTKAANAPHADDTKHPPNNDILGDMMVSRTGKITSPKTSRTKARVAHVSQKKAASKTSSKMVQGESKESVAGRNEMKAASREQKLSSSHSSRTSSTKKSQHTSRTEAGVHGSVQVKNSGSFKVPLFVSGGTSAMPIPPAGLSSTQTAPAEPSPEHETVLETDKSSALLPAMHDESATLPPDTAAVDVTLTDFSSLSQVLKSGIPRSLQETDSCVTEMETESETGMRAAPDSNLQSTNPEKIQDDDDARHRMETEETAMSVNNSDAHMEMEVDVTDSADSCIETSNDKTPDSSRLGNPKSDREVAMDRSSPLSWTREEDKIILQMFQLGCSTEQTLHKISQQLSQRTVSEIQNRFHILMNLLQQMTGVNMDADTSNTTK